MANIVTIVTDVEKDIQIVAQDALSFISRASSTLTVKAPGAIAGIGVILGAVATALGDVTEVAANPAAVLNVSLDTQTAHDLAAVWPDVVALAAQLGIKL